MNCTRIEKLIPLYVGGDLPAGQTEVVREHIETCADCRELVAEFDESQNWLRDLTPPQFDDAVFNDLRDTVRREIGMVQSRPSLFDLLLPVWNMRLAVAASSVLLLLITGLVVYLNRHQSLPTGSVANRNNDEKQAKKNDTVDPETERNAVYTTNSSSSRRNERQNLRRFHPAHTQLGLPDTLPLATALGLILPPVPQTEAIIGLSTQSYDYSEPNTEGPADSLPMDTDLSMSREMLRIEIQTADPNIRIIWLVPKDEDSIKSNSNNR